MPTPEILLYVVYAVLAAAALQDLWRLRIANVFPVALVALFGVWVFLRGFEADIWQNAVVFLAVLVIGAFLFSKGWFGGGDVKLFAAIALWFDFAGGVALVSFVTIGGGLLSLAFIALRRLSPAGLRERTGWEALKSKGPIPYGLAIAAGAVLCLQLHGPNPDAPPALPDFVRTLQGAR